jgi:hypothetical protein
VDQDPADADVGLFTLLVQYRACYFGGHHHLGDAERVIVSFRGIPRDVLAVSAERPRGRPRRGDNPPARQRAVVLGSDWPMTDPGAEIATIRSLGLTAEKQDAVLGGYIARLFGLTA